VPQLPKGRDVDDDDSFMFNDIFTAPLYRIKVYLFVCQVIRVVIMIPTCISLTTVKREFVDSKTLLLILVGKTAGLLNFDCHSYDGDWKLTRTYTSR
jgi:hypothetical protein